MNTEELERKFKEWIFDLAVAVYRRGANGQLLLGDKPDDDDTIYYAEVSRDGVSATHAIVIHPGLDAEIGHIARRLVLKWAEARYMRK